MKKETLEDREKRAEELLKASIEVFTNSSSNYKARRGFIEGAKWQAERMYSEEEVIKIIYQLHLEMQIDKDFTFMKVDGWFEQFKKK